MWTRVLSRRSSIFGVLYWHVYLIKDKLVKAIVLLGHNAFFVIEQQENSCRECDMINIMLKTKNTSLHWAHSSPDRLHTWQGKKKVIFARARAHTLAHRVESRHRNLRQLRRLRSPHTVTSGFSVALRGFSRLIYLFTRYIIYTDYKDTLAHWSSY